MPLHPKIVAPLIAATPEDRRATVAALALEAIALPATELPTLRRQRDRAVTAVIGLALLLLYTRVVFPVFEKMSLDFATGLAGLGRDVLVFATIPFAAAVFLGLVEMMTGARRYRIGRRLVPRMPDLIDRTRVFEQAADLMWLAAATAAGLGTDDALALVRDHGPGTALRKSKPSRAASLAVLWAEAVPASKAIRELARHPIDHGAPAEPLARLARVYAQNERSEVGLAVLQALVVALLGFGVLLFVVASYTTVASLGAFIR